MRRGTAHGCREFKGRAHGFQKVTLRLGKCPRDINGCKGRSLRDAHQTFFRKFQKREVIDDGHIHPRAFFKELMKFHEGVRG